MKINSTRKFPPGVTNSEICPCFNSQNKKEKEKKESIILVHSLYSFFFLNMIDNIEHKSYHFYHSKCKMQWPFVILTMLCNHHHYLFLKFFIILKRNFVPIKQYGAKILKQSMRPMKYETESKWMGYIFVANLD